METPSLNQPDNWVLYAPKCEKCGRLRKERETYGGVYARGRRMSVCAYCYDLIVKDPKAYRKQWLRYRKNGIA